MVSPVYGTGVTDGVNAAAVSVAPIKGVLVVWSTWGTGNGWLGAQAVRISTRAKANLRVYIREGLIGWRASDICPYGLVTRYERLEASVVLAILAAL